MPNKIIEGTITSFAVDVYKRLNIRVQDRSLFGVQAILRIIYRDEVVEKKIDNKLFREYGQIDDDKFKEWSDNKYSKIDIDVTDVDSGKITIMKIDTGADSIDEDRSGKFLWSEGDFTIE